MITVDNIQQWWALNRHLYEGQALTESMYLKIAESILDQVYENIRPESFNSSADKREVLCLVESMKG